MKGPKIKWLAAAMDYYLCLSSWNCRCQLGYLKSLPFAEEQPKFDCLQKIDQILLSASMGFKFPSLLAIPDFASPNFPKFSVFAQRGFCFGIVCLFFLLGTQKFLEPVCDRKTLPLSVHSTIFYIDLACTVCDLSSLEHASFCLYRKRHYHCHT
jgi:hypothetical protein